MNTAPLPPQHQGAPGKRLDALVAGVPGGATHFLGPFQPISVRTDFLADDGCDGPRNVVPTLSGSQRARGSLMADGARAMAQMLQTVPGPETQRDFRNALGRFTTGVTVVTAPAEDGPIGITVNSFASVSLDPPLVLWCPAKASTRYDAFVEAEHFAIHVMGAEHSRIAQAFARSATAFEGLATHENPQGVVVFDDCIARFECTKEQTHDAGDHMIVVGRVTLATHREGEALVFSRGLYGRFMGV